ncbi:SDR family NAD(P)-dependent oxidoreductase [Altericroceibacterium spongiae]|uniref:SDR family NAD(P)-dependent oxidoreductase n=1 Tax=Altericroceibacterium spongiae TaxID=2320269 RepID=A0A420ES86_9SPHN|nr:SDR family NAD(P)-dependent oxidoreductase [Altericroceibacterium spongiae]RKF23535.1 SDR family NAD(P)-dependent oxidoreductase [Altericroceibacterium spongiae]
MTELEGKTAFITGGGSGVALGQAKVLAEEAGMKVVIADIRQDALDEAMAYFAGRSVAVHPIRLDLTDRAAYAEAADEAERVFGPVQLLCNTAGVSQFGPIADATYDDWDWQMDVNVNGVINGCMTFIPRMIGHGQGGHILITASMSAFVALPSTGIYCTTKYAVRGLAESLRVEMPQHNIGVSLLCPGGVNTNIHRAVETRPEKYGKTGYYGADEAVFARLKSVIEGGFDPVDLGRVAREGIERDQFWILPYPEFADGQKGRDEEIIEAMMLYKDHPDTIRRAKMREEAGSTMPGASG